MHIIFKSPRCEGKKFVPRHDGILITRCCLCLLLGGAVALQGCSGCKGPLTYDFSPDTDNGARPAGASTAGITVSLTGDNSALYAVSHTAGVWRSASNDERAGFAGPWEQLQSSPKYSYSIASDPNNSARVAVGGRDADESKKPKSGVWVSTNLGGRWPIYIDPAASPFNCSSQAVPAVAFSQRSTLIFATACGIGVLPTGASAGNVTVSSLPPGILSISALAVSETKLWARTSEGIVLVSTDDGASFKRATNQPLPANANNFSVRGDATSLAAFDNWVFMSTLGDDNGHSNNYSQIVILDIRNDRWIVQKRVNNALNGTGCGGRRRIKSYVFGQGGRIGSDLQIYFSNAQELYRATSQNQDSTLIWEKIAATGCSGVAPDNSQFQNMPHNDIWDFHTASGGRDLWIATDGGVFQNTPPIKGWVARNHGLHTQYLQNIFAPDSSKEAHAAYATHDNYAWFFTATGWQHEDALGDANWVAGNSATEAAAILALRTGLCDPAAYCNELTGFGNKLPSGNPLAGFVMNNDATFNGPGTFAVIQTLPSEPGPASPLDVIMLTKLPLQSKDANGNLANVPGRLGRPASDGSEAVVLLRNKQFLNNPDINTSQGQGWEIAANNLPSGTMKFWVAGGHSAPVFFVLAQQSGTLKLFHSIGGPPHSQLTQWLELNVQGNLFQVQPWPDSGILDGGLLGPVFVNPYDSYEIYVLTTSGVRHSTTGGFAFDKDQTLTDLLTAHDQYGLVGNFLGNGGVNIDLQANYATPFASASFGTLSAMSFSRSHPGEVVAASPFTGVFLKEPNGNWVDVNAAIPKPLSPISGLALTDITIYIATKGRGVLGIQNFRPGG